MQALTPALFLTPMLLLAACNGPTIVESVSAAVAVGTVTDTQGAGLAGVTVRGSFCTSADLDEWQTLTGASGGYDLLMNTFSGIDLEWCVALVAEAAPGSGFAPDTVRVVNVLFTAASPEDTVQVNFVLEN
jgi:hypothetical protein